MKIDKNNKNKGDADKWKMIRITKDKGDLKLIRMIKRNKKLVEIDKNGEEGQG